MKETPKKIGVFTGTRADYGLLRFLMQEIVDDQALELILFASGSHLSTQFGYTINAITADGFVVNESVDMLLSSDTRAATVKSLGVGLLGFADALERQKPDLVIVLGDRYEALGFAQASSLMGVPIMHLHGGEISEGALDDAMRHAITKLSTWHVVSAEEHRRRVVQLGESPNRVFNFGALGLDENRLKNVLSRKDLMQFLGLNVKDEFALITYHPATAVPNENYKSSFNNLIKALLSSTRLKLVVTYPNADANSQAIFDDITYYRNTYQDRFIAVASLGEQRYLTAVKYSKFVIGNSSSGLIEVPAFKVPTINVGERQKGRLKGSSVIDCGVSQKEIEAAIQLVEDGNFRNRIKLLPEVFGSGKVCYKIVSLIKTLDINTRKSFYDIELKDNL